MTVIKAHTFAQVRKLLDSGKCKEVALDFDITMDVFFKIATELGDLGAKINKAGNLSGIKLKSTTIPPVE